MFEAEYKKMIKTVAPSYELIAKAIGKAQTAVQGKKPIRRVRGAVLLAAILLLGTACAAAIGIPQMILLNWQGNDVTAEMEEVLLEPIITPNPVTNTLAKEIISQAPDNEIWIVRNTDDGSQSIHLPIERIDTLDILAQRISQTGYNLQSPTAIPDGYTLTEGNIRFFASFKTVTTGVKLYSEATTPEGLVVEKYSVPDTHKSDMQGYYLMFENSAGSRLLIMAKLQEKDSRHYFPVYDGHSEQISLSGMDQGIYFQDENNEYLNSLYLHKAGLPIKTYYDWTIYADSNFPPTSDLAFTLEAATYSICADDLSKEQLIKIAESMN